MPKRVTISMADPFIDAFSVLKSNFNRAADPDKQEKMSPYRRRNLGLMQDGRKEHINTRRIMGNLNDPKAEPEKQPPKLADDVDTGHSGQRGSKAEADAFLTNVPPMQRLEEQRQQQEDAKKPETEEEDLYANIFDSMQRSFDTLETLDALQKGEPVDFCSCCTPMEKAFALIKAKKKSKPFHGYNPNRHHRKGGLNAKGRAAAKRKTGANLKPPVTTKPSKLKPGSKKAKRRKSFCARMGGMKGPTSKKGKLTPKGAALKRWNC